MEDLRVKYKYNIKMPTQTATLEALKAKIYNKHVDTILEGKEALLISPVFYQNNIEYIQPIFDFDGRKGGGILQAYDEAENLKKVMEKFSSIIELTRDGCHLTFQIGLYGLSVEEIRKELKNVTLYKTVDIPATFKDLPIYRFGSYREENYTMIPVDNLYKNIFKEVDHKKPIELFDKENWLNLWKGYLFPTQPVSANAFLNRQF